MVSTVSYNKNNCKHFYVQKHHKNPQKVSKILKDTHTRTLLHKLVFMPKHFSNKSKKGLFWWLLPDSLIEWIFLHADVFKNFISRKKRLYRNSWITVQAENKK